jgi:hypothetical protein
MSTPAPAAGATGRLAAPPTRLVLVEGLPGSGKTTTAAWLAGWLRARGVSASWSLEASADHPVIDRALRRTARDPGYADRCVAAWRRYADDVCAAARPGAIAVLEGCFFQSTVRFLLEHLHGAGEPQRYLRASEVALAPLAPVLVYLAQPRAETHLAQRLDARKEPGVVARIAAYTETTPCARQHGWTGRSGMTAFYLHYDRTCRDLVARTVLPTLLIDAGRADRPAVQRRVARWLEARGIVRARAAR